MDSVARQPYLLLRLSRRLPVNFFTSFIAQRSFLSVHNLVHILTHFASLDKPLSSRSYLLADPFTLSVFDISLALYCQGSGFVFNLPSWIPLQSLCSSRLAPKALQKLASGPIINSSSLSNELDINYPISSRDIALKTLSSTFYDS